MEKVLNNLCLHTIDNDWLAECLDYYKEQQSDIETELYNQIIYTDLSEIVSTTVVENGTEIPPFLAQINDIDEIGVSKQSLLSEVEAQFSRKMLKLTLTDGIAQFFGIELEPLSGIDLESPLGLKVIVSGRLRHGVLLLRSSNFRIVGGSVEDFNTEPVKLRLENKFRVALGMEAKSSSNTETTSQANPGTNLPRGLVVDLIEDSNIRANSPQIIDDPIVEHDGFNEYDEFEDMEWPEDINLSINIKEVNNYKKEPPTVVDISENEEIYPIDESIYDSWAESQDLINIENSINTQNVFEDLDSTKLSKSSKELPVSKTTEILPEMISINDLSTVIDGVVQFYGTLKPTPKLTFKQTEPIMYQDLKASLYEAPSYNINIRNEFTAKHLGPADTFIQRSKDVNEKDVLKAKIISYLTFLDTKGLITCKIEGGIAFLMALQ